MTMAMKQNGSGAEAAAAKVDVRGEGMQISSWQNCSVHCQAGVVSVEQVALSTSRWLKVGKVETRQLDQGN